MNTAGTTYYPVTVLTGTSATAVTSWPQQVWPALPSVVSPEAERDPFRDARLTPVEWLRQQVEDVCVRARAAA